MFTSIFKRRVAAAKSNNVSMVEQLEGRQLMAAHISGVVYNDVTGNGLSNDDRRAGAAITVNLYHDVNTDGYLDAGDTLVASTLTRKNGAYHFRKVELGNYVIDEVEPTGAVRTGPMYAEARALEVAKSKTYNRNNFAHYNTNANDLSQVTNITYVINGTTTVTTLAGNLKQGDTVEARFTLLSKQTVSLVSYKATDPLGQPLSAQYIFDKASATLKAGTYSLKVKVPNCYFQVDMVAGRPIDHFGEPHSNVSYTDQSRLFSAGLGGDNANPAGTSWSTQQYDKDIVKGKNAKYHGVFYFSEKSGTFKQKH